MRATALHLSALVALTSCWTGHETQGAVAPLDPAPVVARRPLKVEFRVEPASFNMTQLASVVTAFVVTNTSAETLDPQLDKAQLMINGTPSAMWFNTNGNGGREPEWYKLPPGQSVRREYTIAETLFDAPGDYTFVLKVSGIASAPVHVHVSP